nr:Thromboxane-A synthase [Polyrhizophydium stewartii]
MLMIRSNFASNFKNHEYFKLVLDEHGTTAEIWILGNCLFITKDPVLIHQALTDTASFRRNEFLIDKSQGILDDALFILPSGDKWKRHRKQLQPAFSPQQLRNACPVIAASTDSLLNHFAARIDAEGGSAVADMFDEFTALAFDLIGRIGFSFDLKAVESLHNGTNNESREILEDVAVIVQQRISMPTFAWGWANIGPNSPRVKKIRKFLDDLFSRVIAEKKAANAANSAKNANNMDVLDRLLLGSDELGTFSKDEVIGEMAAFFFAGHETTANSMTFVCLELARNPGIQARLHDEIKAVLAALKEPLGPDNLHEFKFLDFVVKESMRLHPVAGQFGRAFTRDFEYNGVVVPAGVGSRIVSMRTASQPDAKLTLAFWKSEILLSVSQTHTNPEYWPEPERFNPDRWDGLKPQPGTYLPFGDGPMNCIGQKLALIEIKTSCAAIVMIKLLARFNLDLVPEQKLDIISTLTTGLKHGLKVKLTRRVVAVAVFASNFKNHEYFKLVLDELGPTAEIWILGNCLFITKDPVLIHQALTDTASFRRNEFLIDKSQGILDDALFILPSGDKWKRHRKQLQPAFSPQQLRNACPVIAASTDSLLNHFAARIDAEGGSAVADMFDELTALAFDLIGRIGFSFDLKAVESLHNGTNNESREILEDVAVIVQQRISVPTFAWGWANIGTSSPRVKKIRKFLDDLFSRVIAEKKAANAANSAKNASSMDVLDRLLLGSDELGTFSKDEVIGEMAAFFFAGHE